MGGRCIRESMSALQFRDYYHHHQLHTSFSSHFNYWIVYLFLCFDSLDLASTIIYFFDFTTKNQFPKAASRASPILHFKPVFSIKTFSLHIFNMPSIRSLLAGIAITSITLLQSTSAAPTPAPPGDKPTTTLALPVNGGTFSLPSQSKLRN